MERFKVLIKPNLLVPVSNSQSVKGIFSFLQNFDYPKGFIKLLGISPEIQLVTVVDNKEQEQQAAKFMAELIELARLPKTEAVIHIGDFNKFVLNAPTADLNIFGLVPEPYFKFMEKMVNNTQTTCLFIRDSGMENILA